MEGLGCTLDALIIEQKHLHILVIRRQNSAIRRTSAPTLGCECLFDRVQRVKVQSCDKVGIGAAISLVLLVAILTLTLIQLRVLRGRRGEA